MTYEEKYDFLTENNIATDDEINLVVKINGYTEEQLDNILFVRTGYTSFESYIYYECGEFDDLFYDDDEEEDEDDFDEEGYNLFWQNR